ncbi:MAG TPA: hypothetical protein VK204_00115 [Nocardioidaceae bacterium]|nr:hypothetical protein [Nocardioidaceae bacterium]
MELGSASVRLDAYGVSFLPGPFQRWRGAQQVDVPYVNIAGLKMTEPRGLLHGTLTLRLHSDGDACSVSFGQSQLREMRRVQAEIWRRARAARDDGAASAQ